MSELDPELDAKWRAASREEPPSALDDAIRAAARREVGARPGGFRAAPRWLPFAAAATVAAIAVGIVQMTPPEQVTPAAGPAPIDAVRRGANADKPMANEPRPEAPVAAAAPDAQRGSPSPKPLAKEQGQAADENDRGLLARNRSDTFAAPPEAQFREKKSPAGRQATLRAEESFERDRSLKQKAELAAASPTSPPAPVAVAASPPPVLAERNQLQPFPAAPAEAGAGNAPPPPVATAAPPAAAPHVSTSSSPIAARKLAAQSSATGAVSASLDAKERTNAQPATDAATLEKSGAVDNRNEKVTPDRRKDAGPLAPDEWIRRIRRLIAEGTREDAAKELAAFRREYKERSDALLPADLRTFKP